MTDVTISYVNQLRARIHSDSGIAREIWEEFSFFVQGYKFMPAYKRGWDGKVHMFDMRSRTIYRGLLPKVVEWLISVGYSVAFEEKEKFRPEWKFDPAWLDRWAEYSTLEPFDDQYIILKETLALNQALVLSPTGSGKSFLAYMMCRWIMEHTDKRILITVPRTSLVEQLYTDFEDYAVNWSVAQNVHRIYSGKEKDFTHRICVTTWQSVYKMPPTWFKQFGAYICDEAHEADGKSITAIVDNITDAPFRVGMTGTLDGTVMHELEMLGRFGPLVKKTSTKELMDKGRLAKLSIDAIILEYSDEERKLIKEAEYQDEINFLINHKMRNKFLVNTALKTQGNVLMLFNYIEKHGKQLCLQLNEKAKKYGKTVYYIDGGVGVDAREEIRRILEKESNAILLASYGTTSTGINIKRINCIVFCHPYKSKIRILQSIGRGLRIAEDKDGMKLIDVGDDLVWKTKRGKEKMNSAMRHFIERLQTYENEGFEYRIIKLPLTT